MIRRRRKKLRFWSSRKFLLLWQLYRHKDSEHDLIDFVTPLHYPVSVQTDSHELIRILICATNLGDFGIHLTRTKINDFTLSIIDKDKRVIIDQKIVLDELYPHCLGIVGEELFKTNPGKSQQELKRQILTASPQPFLASQVLASLLAKILDKILNSFHGIDQDGNGEMDWDEGHSNLDTNLFTHLAPLMRLEFSINRRRFNHRFRQYLEAFHNGQVLPRKGLKAYPSEKNLQIFTSFIRDLSSENNQHILSFELGESNHSPGNLEDAFTHSFKNHHPTEYKSWRSGLYHYPFFEILAWAEYKGWLRVQDFVIATNGVGFLKRILRGDQLTRNRNFNAVKLKSYLSLEIVSRDFLHEKTDRDPDTEKEISLLEIVITERLRYKVYVNGDRKRPVYLSRSNKAGEIIYAVAQGLEISYRRYRKNMDYINQDANFKLYSQSDFSPTQLLARHWDEDSDSFIGAAEGVSIRLIEE